MPPRSLNCQRTILKTWACLFVALSYSTNSDAARFPIVDWLSIQGSGATDFATGIAFDQRGAIVISGSTTGTLGGPYQGATDAFAQKLDVVGPELFTRQFGTTSYDSSNDVAT